jgi:hypothetical protein
VKDVRNFLIGPVYAHQSSVMDDDSKVHFDRSKPIGILQLINKKNYEKIGDYDLRKFEAMQTLIGLSVD